jgi:hypothetical protein
MPDNRKPRPEADLLETFEEVYDWYIGPQEPSKFQVGIFFRGSLSDCTREYEIVGACKRETTDTEDTGGEEEDC